MYLKDDNSIKIKNNWINDLCSFLKEDHSLFFSFLVGSKVGKNAVDIGNNLAT